MSTKARKPVTPSFDETYHPGDPIPVPDAVEKSSETAWELWSELKDRHEAQFETTRPMTQPAPLPDRSERAYASTEPSLLTPRTEDRPIAPPKPSKALRVEDVMVEARRNNRVCPMPQQWSELYQMLPGKKLRSNVWTPTEPLLGAAWTATPSLAKRMCFREHVEWAASHDFLEDLHTFITALPEQQWYHMGDA